MAYDAGMLSAVIAEINRFCDGHAHVEKVLMPSPDEVVLVLHAGRETKRLTLSASGNSPRLTFTSTVKENPPQPPMFCMLLRKHLTSATLTQVKQEGFDRVARLCFASRDEMGYDENLYLMIEIMGKYSNLMLLGADDRVLGVLRAVDFTTSRLRQVLPGMTYELPPSQEKADPRAVGERDLSEMIARADADTPAVGFITSSFLGTATQTAREIVWLASGRMDTKLGDLSPARFSACFVAWFRDLTEGRFTPTLVTDRDGVPTDFSYAPVHYLENAAKTVDFADFSALFDAFYGARDRAEHIRVMSADLTHLLHRETSRLSRKLEAQRDELAQAGKAEEYCRMGDLLTANLFRVKRGDAFADCTDWAAEGTPTVRVALDTRLTPAANAQRFYKQYNKAKNARRILTAQIAEAENELAYLDSVSVFLEKAETESDLADIRAELRAQGILKTVGKLPPRGKKATAPALRSFQSPGGYKVMVGANNLQNEYLTFSLASKNDLWFHVKGMPGSHVILFCDGEEPPEEDYTFAAVVAAHFSRAEGKGTAVDYTRVRELRRVPGARPGFVVYHTNWSCYVDPADFSKLIGES